MRAIPLIFGLQWLLWWFFLPDRPTVPTGEPKYYGLGSIALWGFYFYSLILGVWLGKRVMQSRRGCPNQHRGGDKYYLYGVAVVAFWVSFASQLYRYKSLLDLEAVLGILFTPYGQNKLAAYISEESPFGLASLGVLWIVSAVVFAQLCFDTEVSAWLKRRASFYLWGTGALTFIYGLFEAARVSFITYALIVLGAFLLTRRLRLKVRTIVLVVGMIGAWVWGGSLIRTGIDVATRWNLPLLSPEVQSYLWSELAEKYLGGELNNALIMMSYPADVSSNWAYGTMIARWFPTYGPPRYLNTNNILGLWYWQFGQIGGAVVSFVIGFGLGRLYRRAEDSPRGLSWASCYYLIAYPGFWGMTRINYFFLWSFVVPLVVLIGAQVARSLLFTLSTPVSRSIVRESIRKDPGS